MATLTKKDKERLSKLYQKQIDSGELIQIELKDKKDFRLKWFNKQKGICPIIQKEMPFEKSSIDHKHKLKSDAIGGKDRSGLVRGILYFPANAWEGKVVNSFKRMGLSKYTDIVSALRALANYLEKPPIPPLYVYPGEQPKLEKKLLGKRIYTKIRKHYFKVYPKKRKIPKKTKYLTKKWQKVICDVDAYLQKKQSKKKAKMR